MTVETSPVFPCKVLGVLDGDRDMRCPLYAVVLWQDHLLGAVVKPTASPARNGSVLEPIAVHFEPVLPVFRNFCQNIVVPNVLVRSVAEDRRAFEDGLEYGLQAWDGSCYYCCAYLDCRPVAKIEVNVGPTGRIVSKTLLCVSCNTDISHLPYCDICAVPEEISMGAVAG